MSSLRRKLGDVRRALTLSGRRGDAAAVQRLFWLLREPNGKPGAINWRGRPLRYADGPALYYQLGEIFVDRIYDFACEREDPRILDVGAHVGVATLRFLELFPRARLTSFEPDPAIVDLLRANVAAVKGARGEVVNSAAWIEDGTSRFAATGSDNGALAANGSITVKTVDLARFCAEPVDLLKIDIEGAEFELLEHLCRSNALSFVQRLVIELHEWNETRPRFHEALATLTAVGFNYRLRSAVAKGGTPHPAGFTTLAHPANLVALHAWRGVGR